MGSSIKNTTNDERKALGLAIVSTKHSAEGELHQREGIYMTCFAVLPQHSTFAILKNIQETPAGCNILVGINITLYHPEHIILV